LAQLEAFGWFMLDLIALLLLPPMLIEFGILRCGVVSNVPLSILTSAFLTSLLGLGFYIACHWGIETMNDGPPQTPGDRLIDIIIFPIAFIVLITGFSLIPAGLFGIVYSWWKRARHKPAA
jgi:hypothetical protein